jgi:hypothetical protein
VNQNDIHYYAKGFTYGRTCDAGYGKPCDGGYVKLSDGGYGKPSDGGYGKPSDGVYEKLCVTACVTNRVCALQPWILSGS